MLSKSGKVHGRAAYALHAKSCIIEVMDLTRSAVDDTTLPELCLMGVGSSTTQTSISSDQSAGIASQ